MKLQDARLCLDCDCVYDSKINPLWQEICPDCSSRATYLLVNWLGGEASLQKIKTPHPCPLPQGEREGERKEDKIDD